MARFSYSTQYGGEALPTPLQCQCQSTPDSQHQFQKIFSPTSSETKNTSCKQRPRQSNSKYKVSPEAAPTPRLHVGRWIRVFSSTMNAKHLHRQLQNSQRQETGKTHVFHGGQAFATPQLNSSGKLLPISSFQLPGQDFIPCSADFRSDVDGKTNH